MTIKKTQGSILIEILIAVSVFSMILIGTTSLMNTSSKSIINSGERIIALGLAREGLEGVRQIRDSNLLYCPANKTNMWKDWLRDGALALPNPTCAPTLTNINKILYLDFDTTKKFFVLKQGAANTVADIITGLNIDTSYQLCNDPVTGKIYYDSACATTNLSKFYRYIDISYCTTALICGGSNTLPIAKVNTTILWKNTEINNISNLSITTYLHLNINDSI